MDGVGEGEAEAEKKGVKLSVNCDDGVPVVSGVTLMVWAVVKDAVGESWAV